MKRYKWYKCSVCESSHPCKAATLAENIQPTSACILADGGEDGYDPGPARWVEIDLGEEQR